MEDERDECLKMEDERRQSFEGLQRLGDSNFFEV